MDANDQSVLYAKNADEQAPMASTTKIMTCLVALTVTSLDDIVTVLLKILAVPHFRVCILQRLHLKADCITAA